MSTQYGNQSGANASTTGGSQNAGTSSQASGSTYGATGGGQRAASDSNWGSARSDYGDEAYGGSLDEQGLGGSGYDDFSEGRRDEGSRGEPMTRGGTRSGARGSSTRGRVGYSLGDTGNTGLTLLAGMVIGAGLMYLFDPEQGGRRRALLRDKFIALSNDTTDIVGKTSRDLRNRAQGVIAETTKAIGLRGRKETGEEENAGGSNTQGGDNISTQQASAAGA